MATDYAATTATQSLDLPGKPRQHRPRTSPRSHLSAHTPLDLKDIKIIIDLMKKNDLSVFEMEKEGFKIRLKKGSAVPEGYTVTNASAPFAPAPLPQTLTPPPAPSAAETAAPAAKGREITSPMVGTFYQAMSPESPAYVKVGQSVTEDTVVCIIEAMKVMNEIKAEAAGVVTEILGENGKPVQFGQPLFRLQ